MKTTTGPEIAKKIRALCESRGLTVKQFEREVGLSNGYLRKLSIQQSTPSADRLRMISDYFQVTPDWLMGTAQGGKAGSSGVRIPLIGRVAAGIPIEAAENVIGEEEISFRMAQKGEFFALLIKGDSMSPFIMDGDKVIVSQTEDAENGDIVIALIDGKDGVCKEFKHTATGIMLISKNPNYDPMVFTNAEIDTEPVRIIGKVVEVRRTI